MFLQKFSPGLFCLFLWGIAGPSFAAEPPLTIEGLADKRYPGYSDRVSFRVPSSAGYSYYVLLNTNPIPTDVTVEVASVDYHELYVWRTNNTTLEVTNRRVQFIVRSSSRNANQSVEDGIPVWTPFPLINSASNEFVGARLQIIAPAVFPAGYEIPVVAWLWGTNGHAVRANGELSVPGQGKFSLKRGVGSGFLTATNPVGTLDYRPAIAILETNKSITIESAPAWISVAGVLNGETVWPDDSRMLVTGNLTIPAGSSLTIGAGTIVRLNSGVDIFLDGQMNITGSTDRPVVFMPNSRSEPWGGFWLRFNSSQLIGTGTIFTGSGADLTWFGTAGHPGSHRREQALFYLTNSTPRVSLTDSAAIYLTGQLGHAYNGGNLNFTRFLMQRCTTGGEYTGANFTVNDSAFIECPDDTANFVDGDNDGLYLVSGTHGFTNMLLGWVKDDGIDSGGSSAGIFNYDNCWFESTFHEGNSLSGTGKQVNHYEGVFINCGQGIEDGYEGPTGRVERCFITGCLVGVRFGDNYNNSYTGFIRATNSILAYNYRDVWGLNWQDWTYRVSAMDVRSNYLGVVNTNHPHNYIWNPAADGWRLASLMSTPPEAAVGIGLALHNPTIDRAQLSNGIPVRLSSFTTNFVSIDYAIEAASGLVTNGVVVFAPGETLKYIPGLIASAQSPSFLRVSLRNPVRSEITGLSRVFYVDTVAALPTLIAKGSEWRYLADGSNQEVAWQELNFDDSDWESGRAELGFGDGDETTVIPNNGQITTYFRHRFMVSDPTSFSELSLWLLRDDGGVVYLNGMEVFRSTNMPSGVIAYNDLATGPTAEDAIDTPTVATNLLEVGTNIVTVEIHQRTTDSSDVSFDFELLGVAPTQAPRLQILRFGNEIVLYWTDSTYNLLEAETVTGLWQPVAASSPVTLMPAGNRFYQLRKP